MINDVHAAVSGSAVRAVNRAFGEVRVRDVVRRLEEVGELVKYVRDRGRGAGVEEGDKAGVVADQFAESGPGREPERGGGRRVGVFLEVAGCVRGIEQTDMDVVTVYEKERDDLVGVGVEPCFDIPEIV